MSEKITVEGDLHLAALLELRERELQEARARIASLEHDANVSKNLGWMYQIRMAYDIDELPAPRVQMTLHRNAKSTQDWQLAMFYVDTSGLIVRVPLDQSCSGGQDLNIEALFENKQPGTAAGPDILNVLPSLLEDLWHAHTSLNLPAYVVMDDHQLQITAVSPEPQAEVIK